MMRVFVKIFLVFALVIIGQTAFTLAESSKKKRESVAAFASVNASSFIPDFTPVDETNPDLAALVETEKAFAATAVKVGFRDSFIQFFDDHGIGFGPDPEETKPGLIKLPARTTPSPVVFNWQPMFGDISYVGDYGYTTGPLIYTQRADPTKVLRHGMYFSVWKKQADGTWKVIIDLGVDTPNAIAPIDVAFTPAVNSNAIRKTDAAKSGRGSFDTLDADFSADIAKYGLAKTYAGRVNNQFRIHRDGKLPITTNDDLAAYLGARTDGRVFKMIGGNISASNDFAYTYGSSQTASGDKLGYYVHVWRRDNKKNWKLAVDIYRDLPKKE